jgi:hypothetical protein
MKTLLKFIQLTVVSVLFVLFACSNPVQSNGNSGGSGDGG